MPLRVYRHRKTGEVRRSLKSLPSEHWIETLSPPYTKFTEITDATTGKSRPKDQHEVLLERSRNHSRDVDLDDQMRVSLENQMGAEAGKNLLNSKGERRTKLDDM